MNSTLSHNRRAQYLRHGSAEVDGLWLVARITEPSRTHSEGPRMQGPVSVYPIKHILLMHPLPFKTFPTPQLVCKCASRLASKPANGNGSPRQSIAGAGPIERAPGAWLLSHWSSARRWAELEHKVAPRSPSLKENACSLPEQRQTRVVSVPLRGDL
ncbi:hypothetical protein AAFF_G00263010 [Aldrovandia affinis]|uniref:Uncharacterized protein n=1 Tax=Aldrovandia affinis TaxID=143900 RepID=A0AAD7WT55_9TELE|nr:hypothetical protein AAFF_G00263010 [Aldrovandia affinis]